MHLRPLVFRMLVIFLVRECLSESEYWKKFNADLSAVDNRYKTHHSIKSPRLCASLTAVKSPCIFCITGTSCVVVSTPLEPVGNPVAVQCYKKTGTLCCPPFMHVPGVGCLLINSDESVDFNMAKTSCPGTSRLWYPKNSTHAENMRKYLHENPKAPNYWIDLKRVSGEWTYGDGRVEAAGSGDLPWGPARPIINPSLGFALLAYYPDIQFFYHFSNEPSSSTMGYICA